MTRVKKSLIPNAEKDNDWMVSHASLPVADRINENI